MDCLENGVMTHSLGKNGGSGTPSIGQGSLEACLMRPQRCLQGTEWDGEVEAGSVSKSDGQHGVELPSIQSTGPSAHP